MTQAHIVESNGKNKICSHCTSIVFYLSRGKKRKDIHNRIIKGVKTKTWLATAYYIIKCAYCGERENQTIYDWRRVSTFLV